MPVPDLGRKRNNRFCKSKCDRYRRIVTTLGRFVHDPVAFEEQLVNLPPSIAESEVAKTKLVLVVYSVAGRPC